MRVDLHLHTTASDGTESPERVTALARESGLDLIAITDHDTVSGLAEAKRSLPEGVRLISGVEMSCSVTGEDGFRCHILGYGIDPDSASMTEAIALGREKRQRKLEDRIAYLKDRYGIALTEEEAAFLRGKNSPSRLHLGQLLVAKGLCSDIDSAIMTYLDYRSLPDGRLGAEYTISVIKRAGGVPIFAHPLGGEGEAHLERRDLYRRVDILKDLGIMGLEGFYSRYTEEEEDFLCRTAQKRGLLVSAGSDWHGANKTVSLGSLSVSGKAPSVEDVTLVKYLLGK